MDFRKLKEGEEVLKSVTPELNQRVEQAKSNMWKIQNMFLDEDQGKNFIFHILNDQGKKFSAKILVPEKRKNGEPIILFVVENFI